MKSLALVLIGFALFLNACTSPEGSKSSRISAGAVLRSNLSSKDKAEKLAQQAETLVTAQGFLQAQDVIQLALKEDPQNFRAQFWNVLMGPILKNKGILVRVRGLAEGNAKAIAEYNQNMDRFKSEHPDSALKSFLLDGSPDLKTEKDLQSYMESLTESFDRIRLFLKSASNQELIVQANDLLIQDLNRRFAEACEINENDQYEYELICPSAETRRTLALNEADFAVLRDMASYMMIESMSLTSYDLTGALDFLKSNGEKTDLKAQDVLNSLMKNSSFGTLTLQNRLKQVPDLGLDFILGLRWALSHQNELCSKGQESAQNRPGRLVNKGICVGPYSLSFIDLSESIFRGEAQNLPSEKDGQSYQTTLMPIAVFTSPIKDLRSLGMQFDDCNQLKSVTDPTAGGLFPKQDANQVIPLRIGECQK